MKSEQEKRQPWIKWYPTDWRADPKLHMCSLAARGLWIEMLGYMHEAEIYGRLLIASRVPDMKELAALVGSDPKTVLRCFEELKNNGVFSIDESVPYSRRMVRDKAKADADKANGGRGGNPRLKSGNNGGYKPPDNDGVNPPDKAHMPEARCQSSEAKASGADAPSLEAEVFRRGKELLGGKAGGQITKLRKALGFDDVAVLAVFNEAKFKDNKAEWVAGVINHRNAPTPEVERPFG
jgi:hypothetical protein